MNIRSLYLYFLFIYSICIIICLQTNSVDGLIISILIIDIRDNLYSLFNYELQYTFFETSFIILY